MPSLGNLFVTIGANTDQLNTAAAQSTGVLNRLSQTMRGAATVAASLTIAAGAAGAGIVFGLVQSGRLAIDTQAKLAQSLDATIGGLRAVEQAAGDAGVSTEELYGEATKLNSRLGDATKHTGEAYKALKQLGLSAEDLLGLDLDQRFAAIADAMAKQNLAGAQAQDIMRDLGVRNENLANLMRQGGEAFRFQAEEVKNLGLNLSMIDAAQVEAANDSLGIFQDVLQVVQDRLTVAAAPYITVIAEKFREAAIESGGFRDIIDKVIQGIVTGFAKAADFVHGLNVVFKGLKSILQGLWALWLTGISAVAERMSGLGDVMANMTNAVVTAYNKITGSHEELMQLPSESPFMIGLTQAAEEARIKVGELNQEFLDSAAMESYGEKAKRFLKEVSDASIEAAKKTVEARKTILGQAGGAGSREDTSEADDKAQEQYKKDMEAWNAKNAAELEAVKNRYMTEAQLLETHREEMLIIGDSWDQTKFETEEQWRSVHEQAEAAHLERMTQLNRSAYAGISGIIDQHWGKNAASTAGAIKSIVGTMATGSRKAFEVSKAWAMADALISTYQGIAAGVKLGWPMGIPAVAWAAATGFAQVSQIKNQSFGGGGGAAASGAGTAGVAPNPIGVGGSTSSAPGNNQTLTVAPIDPNAIFSGSAMQSFGKNLVNFQKDGGKVVFSA